MDKFTAEEYLKIDIANNFGKDKLNYKDRIKWFDSQENLESLTSKAKEPAMFLAGVLAYRKAIKGEAIGYPISLDATASGMQILSILANDPIGAALTNVIDSDDRQDAYTVIYDIMKEQTKGSKLERDQVKKAIMVSLYGSDAGPKELFSTSVLPYFYKTITETIPRVWELNTLFLGLWNKEVEEYRWTLPDNFHVVSEVHNIKEETVIFDGKPITVKTKVKAKNDYGRSLGANTVHSIDAYFVREVVRRCSLDREIILRAKAALCYFGSSDTVPNTRVTKLWNQYLRTGMLSARILQYLDEDSVHTVDRDVVWKLINSLPTKQFTVLTIHDSFRVLPQYGNDVREQYVNLLKELGQSNLLGSILEDLTGKEFVTPKFSFNIGGNYAIC